MVPRSLGAIIAPKWIAFAYKECPKPGGYFKAAKQYTEDKRSARSAATTPI
jgi:hypothetical protein